MILKWRLAHHDHGILQPQTDQGGQCVVQDQKHDGIDKMVPFQTTVDSELPGRGAVGLNDGGDTKHTVEKNSTVNVIITGCFYSLLTLAVFGIEMIT